MITQLTFLIMVDIYGLWLYIYELPIKMLINLLNVTNANIREIMYKYKHVHSIRLQRRDIKFNSHNISQLRLSTYLMLDSQGWIMGDTRPRIGGSRKGPAKRI